MSPLARGHAEDDRLHLPHLFFRIGARELPLQGPTARNHFEQTFQRTHTPQLPDLGEEVVEAQLAGPEMAFDLGRPVLVDGPLGFFDQGQHVADAQDSRCHAFGVERLEVGRLLARTGEPDALTGGHPKRERGSAAGVAVELCQHDPVDPDALTEGLPNPDRLLTRHRVSDEQRLRDLDRGFQAFELLHQLGVHVQAPGCVEDDDIAAEPSRLRDRGPRDVLDRGFACVKSDPLALRQHAELLDPRRSPIVQGRDERAVTVPSR